MMPAKPWLDMQRSGQSPSSSSVVGGVFIQAVFSMDNALMLVFQNVRETFPSLSQTGEGFSYSLKNEHQRIINREDRLDEDAADD